MREIDTPLLTAFAIMGGIGVCLIAVTIRLVVRATKPKDDTWHRNGRQRKQ